MAPPRGAPQALVRPVRWRDAQPDRARPAHTTLDSSALLRGVGTCCPSALAAMVGTWSHRHEQERLPSPRSPPATPVAPRWSRCPDSKSWAGFLGLPPLERDAASGLVSRLACCIRSGLLVPGRLCRSTRLCVYHQATAARACPPPTAGCARSEHCCGGCLSAASSHTGPSAGRGCGKGGCQIFGRSARWRLNGLDLGLRSREAVQACPE
jgi:hypothetical protein